MICHQVGFVERESILGRCDQAIKSVWWMTWRQEAMKDVGTCDKPRGVGNQTVILGFLNGATQRLRPLSMPECIGYGSERRELKHLSTYRKRKKPRFRQ